MNFDYCVLLFYTHFHFNELDIFFYICFWTNQNRSANVKFGYWSFLITSYWFFPFKKSKEKRVEKWKKREKNIEILYFQLDLPSNIFNKWQL